MHTTTATAAAPSRTRRRAGKAAFAIALAFAAIVVSAGQASAAEWGRYPGAIKVNRPLGECRINLGYVYDSARDVNSYGVFAGVHTHSCTARQYQIKEWVRLKFVATDANGNQYGPVVYSQWYSRQTFSTFGDAAGNIVTTAPRGCGRGWWGIEGGVTVQKSASSTPVTYTIPNNWEWLATPCTPWSNN